MQYCLKEQWKRSKHASSFKVEDQIQHELDEYTNVDQAWFHSCLEMASKENLTEAIKSRSFGKKEPVRVSLAQDVVIQTEVFGKDTGAQTSLERVDIEVQTEDLPTEKNQPSSRIIRFAGSAGGAKCRKFSWPATFFSFQLSGIQLATARWLC